MNGVRAGKPSNPVSPGDTLTFAQGERIRVVKVEAIGLRRGPSSEAMTLFSDLSPQAPQPAPGAPIPSAGGRPTKKARRDALLPKDKGPV